MAEEENRNTGEDGVKGKRIERELRIGERRGRPSNVDKLGRDRAQSCGSILEFISVKRKRGEISPESADQKQKSKRGSVKGGQPNSAEKEDNEVKEEEQKIDSNTENMVEQ